MRFGTRAFLVSFSTSSLLLAGSFWSIRERVQATVLEEIRSSLRENHTAIGVMRQTGELRQQRLLNLAGESPVIKAGMQLLISQGTFGGQPSRDEQTARLTLEDQLGELCATLGFDLMETTGPYGQPLAGVMRTPDGQIVPAGTQRITSARRGLKLIDGVLYQIGSVHINIADENLGTLYVGERYAFSDFQTPVALLQKGKLVAITVPSVNMAQAERELSACSGSGECNVRLNGDTWLSMPVDQPVAQPADRAKGSDAGGNGDFTLLSLQNFDAAARPVNQVLKRAFLISFGGAMVVAILLGAFSSRSISKPLGEVVSRLRESEDSGMLLEFRGGASSINEIEQLAEGFNRAARAIQQGRGDLQQAYVEFVGSLASALDARDPYTAGHSQRVSELSCQLAKKLGLSDARIAEVRIGALLHDIGKIGVGDTVLQKPGRLTPDEFRLIQEHPVIGRRILEKVEGFAPYLPSVEFHHENWDGTGYPRGLAGMAVPLSARIIHVADAFDAMTSDRPYRNGMSTQEALGILSSGAGRQFDPEIVQTMVSLRYAWEQPELTVQL